MTVDELSLKLDDQFKKIDDQFKKIDDQFKKVDDQFKKIDDDIRDIRATQFYFEETYGKKIDIMYDVLLGHTEKIKKDSKKIDELNKRVDMEEIKSVNFDTRIISLENQLKFNS